MVLEDILLALAVGIVLIVFGLPIVRLLRAAPWRRADPLAEAHERLRIAQREAEAAAVNREAERIYERLYAETLENEAPGAQPAAGEAAQPTSATAPTEKQHGSK